MKTLETLKVLIRDFDATGGFFAAHKGTLNDCGLALRDEMLKTIKQAEAEHAALVAVAEAAESAIIQISGDLSGERLKSYLVSLLSKPLATLRAQQQGSEVTK